MDGLPVHECEEALLKIIHFDDDESNWSEFTDITEFSSDGKSAFNCVPATRSSTSSSSSSSSSYINVTDDASDSSTSSGFRGFAADECINSNYIILEKLIEKFENETNCSDIDITDYSGDEENYILHCVVPEDRSSSSTSTPYSETSSSTYIDVTGDDTDSSNFEFRGFAASECRNANRDVVNKLIKACYPRLVRAPVKNISRNNSCELCCRKFYGPGRNPRILWRFCHNCRGWVCPTCTAEMTCSHLN